MKSPARPRHVSRLPCRPAALAVAAALTVSPGWSGAQPQPMPMPQAAPQPLPAAPIEGGKSRGVFLAMFAQAVVPSLVSGIDAWLRNKLNVPMQGGAADALQGGNPGSGFRPTPLALPGSPSPLQLPAPALAPAQSPPEDSMSLQAGVAYQVSLVGLDGSRTLVDPAQRAFGTSERIMLAYRTNLPGQVEVYNIDSTGREELIDQQQMGAGQLANLGPYEFVNVKGEETLRIVLRPCVGGQANAATRGMVRAQVNPALGDRLVGCDDPVVVQQRGGTRETRGIAKVQLEGGTNFALDPLSRSEIDSGRLEPREVRVRFLHR